MAHCTEQRTSRPERSRAIAELGEAPYDRVLEVLALAFESDPSFRYASGASGDRHRERVRALVRAALEVHVAGGNPARGVLRNNELLAVSLVESPGASLPWGTTARSLLRLLVSTTPGVTLRSLRAALPPLRRRPREPHHFLSMLAVHPEARGQGLARLLLEDLHADCDAHPDSIGVALDTENPHNVRLYERFGYRVTVRLRVGGLDAWCMLRPKDSSAAAQREPSPCT
jgi:ribosomal protein S18 acetylase RimI-like enzyme